MGHSVAIFNNVREFRRAVSSEESCHALLVQMRWGGVPKCLECGSDNTYFLKTRKIYKCAKPECGYQFSVTKGTIMENTKLPLADWFAIIEEFCTGKMTATDISKKLEINYRTVWSITHKLRNSIGFLNDGMLDGEVEMDEIIFGSIREENLQMSYRMSMFNKNEKKKEVEIKGYKARAYGNKRVIVNIVQRNGRQLIKLIGASKSDLTTENLRKVLNKHVSKDAILYIDAHPTHKGLDDGTFSEVKFIIHTEKIEILDENGEPVLGKNGKPKFKYKKNFKNAVGNHTNTVENSNTHLTAFLKKFRKHSYKYAPLYYNEYVFQCWCRENNFLEKVRTIFWNSQSSYITIKGLMSYENDYPEHKWKEKVMIGKSHSREKKKNPVNFIFS